VPSHAPILQPVNSELQSLLSRLPARPLAARYVTFSTPEQDQSEWQMAHPSSSGQISPGVGVRLLHPLAGAACGWPGGYASAACPASSTGQVALKLVAVQQHDRVAGGGPLF
jgi:hypothetical protein